ncbi:MAG TPA: VWA domain-containing protein [Thermoleophilaceae bacterium]|jgi:Ca-activated chloride channel family protein
MSFGEPTVLLGLLVLPLAVFWYVGEQRRRRLAAQAFAAPALHPSVAPVRPRWRRHAPMAVVALALTALVLAAAKPQRTVAVPIERASIVLTTDVSGSMTATDVKPNRLVAAKRAARSFVERVPARVNVGLVAFNQQPRVLQSPTTDRAEILSAIDAMEPSGGTATGEAIAAALRALDRRANASGRKPPGAIVLLSDGASTSGQDPIEAARAAQREDVRVYTVTLGTPGGTITVPAEGGGTQTVPVPPDPESLERIARESGGRSFDAATAGGLQEVYERLGSQLSHRDEKREVTAAFAGGGLGLLLAAAAMSLRWFGRLI